MKYSESDKSHFVRNGNTRFAIKRPTELQLIRHTFIKCYNQTRNNIIVLVKLEGAAYMTWLNECKGTRHLHGRRGVEAGAGGDSRWREEHRKGNTRVSWFAFKCIIEYTSIRWTAAVANRCLKTLAVDGMDGRARPAGRKGAEWRAGPEMDKGVILTLLFEGGKNSFSSRGWRDNNQPHLTKTMQDQPKLLAAGWRFLCMCGKACLLMKRKSM